MSRMMDALLVRARHSRIVARATAPAPTGRIGGDLEGLVVGLGFLGGGGGRIRRGRDRGGYGISRQGAFRCRGNGLDGWRGGFGLLLLLLLLLGSWLGGRVVYRGVFAGGAGWDGEEFVKGEHARLAAFPACRS